MGSGMARRLLRAGHEIVAYDVSQPARAAIERDGGLAAATIPELVSALVAPRVLWMMLPAAAVERTLDELAVRLEPGDVVVDGGNSCHADDIRRAEAAAARGQGYVDVGVSGGVWGPERGYCLMVGGSLDAIRMLTPIFAALAPGAAAAPRTPGREGPRTAAEEGWLHCGPSGAGHFVKMVHNGIEYGMVAALAEGMNVLRHADAGKHRRDVDTETAPLRHPELYEYELDLAEIAEVWRRGSVITSWLLDLVAAVLLERPDLEGFAGAVSDSGEGRWALQAALDEGVPAPVLGAALAQRFASRGAQRFADKLVSAMRLSFGGHHEKAA
jgi:6-phosphogluconate dehydrogenase